MSFHPRNRRWVWRAGAVVALIVLVIVGAVYALRQSHGPSDDEIRSEIIKESAAAYQAGGRPCACPYDKMANGAECGNFSAYSKPGAAAPFCYPKDVTDAAVQEWRQRRNR